MAGRHPESPLELAGHVALIGKSGHEGGLGKGVARNDRRFDAVETPHGEIAIGAGAETPAEMARQRVAVEAGHAFELLGGHHAHEILIEEGAGAVDRNRRYRERRWRSLRCVEGKKGIGNPGHDPVALQRLERAPEIGKGGDEGVQETRIG